MADRSSFKYRHQPFKTLYLIFHAITSATFVIPWYIIYYTPKSNRQRPSWSRGRAVRIAFIRYFGRIAGNVGPFLPRPTYKAIKGGDHIEADWIPPVPSNLLLGDVAKLAEMAKVTSIQIPGYWYGGRPEKVIKPGDKIFYILHGGSYVSLSAHPDNMASQIPKGLLQFTSVKRAFALEYRLSNYKPFEVCCPFPSALIDAIAGYLFLVNLGYAPADIIVEGDSAGANLALALTRYFVEEGGKYGMPVLPGALILLSPWADLSESNIFPGGSAYMTCDYLGPYSKDDPKWAHHAFMYPFGLEIADTNRFISPASLHPEMTIDFKGFPRTYITGGGAEILRDQIRALEKKMKVDCEVEYFEAEDAVHDWLGFLWHEPERSEALNRIAEWLDQNK